MNKMNWTVEEIRDTFENRTPKTHWNVKQIQVLLNEIDEQDESIHTLLKQKEQLMSVQTFLMTLLDEHKLDEDSIRAAFDALNLKLPKRKK